jgi:hypothetical protein
MVLGPCIKEITKERPQGVGGAHPWPTERSQPNHGVQATASSLVSLLVGGDVGESPAPNRRTR